MFDRSDYRAMELIYLSDQYIAAAVIQFLFVGDVSAIIRPMLSFLEIR